MAYNPYSDIMSIYKSGNDWQETEKKRKDLEAKIRKMKGLGVVDDMGQTAALQKKQQEIANNAQKYYQSLSDNGYSQMANRLSTADSQTRLNLANKSITTGKSPIRNAFYSLGKQYNLSPSDIDNNLKYDNDTGDITFYGQKIARPSSVVDGTAYYDNDVINSTFANTMKNIGKTKSDEYLAGQDLSDSSEYYKRAADNSQKMYDQNISMDNKDIKGINRRTDEYISALNGDIFTSSEANALYRIYGAKGDDAAYGAVADSAATNSGNIDSFAQANAKRQQLAFKNAASEAIMNNFYNKMNLWGNNISSTNSALQGYSQNRWGGMANVSNATLAAASGLAGNSNIRTTNRNDVAKTDADIRSSDNTNYINRTNALSSITGYVPNEALDRENPYLNSDGSVKNLSQDYAALSAQLNQKAKEASDPEAKAELLRAAVQADRAGQIKSNMPEYSQYAVGRTGNRRVQTESARQFDVTDATTNNQINAGLTATLGQAQAGTDQMRMKTDSDYRIAKEANETALATNAKDNATALELKKLSQDEISGAAIGSAKTADGKTMSTKVNEIVNNFNNYATATYGKGNYITSAGTSGYNVNSAYREMFVKNIAEDNTLSVDQKQYIFELFNIPNEVIATVLHDSASHYTK